MSQLVKFQHKTKPPSPRQEDATKTGSDVLVPTIFHEPWWLDKATSGQYRQVETQSGGLTVGRLPFLQSRIGGMTTIGMPTLTHFLGPAIDLGSGNQTTQLLRGLTITGELIAALPKVSRIWIKLHRGIADTVAFQEAGFRTDVQFTCGIEPDAEEVLWLRMRDKTRNVIRRAQEQFTVGEETDPDRFLSFYAHNLRQRGQKNTYDLRQVREVLEESIRRGNGKISVALNDKGNYNSAIVTVSDKRSKYYLMSTRTSDAGNGATSLLVWDEIKEAARNTLIFDFDGARSSADVRFFAGFGGRLEPRYWVWRSSWTSRFAGLLSSIVRRQADRQ